MNKHVDALFEKFIKILSSKYLRFIIDPIVEYVYTLYERYLYNQIKGGRIPLHVAIIPDGNRRWAREHGLDPKEGHVHGYRKMKEVLQWLYDLGVRIVTVYAMSYENCLYRSEEEKENLFTLIANGLRELMESDTLSKYRVRVKVFGKLELARGEIREYAKKLEEMSANYTDRYLNIAICYGGRQEIVDAIKSLINDVVQGVIDLDKVSEEAIVRKLSTSHLPFPEPDLVIRTSGEMRISNFLLWQIAYSELYFCDVYWPEFRKIDLYRAIRSYQKRERRFGR